MLVVYTDMATDQSTPARFIITFRGALVRFRNILGVMASIHHQAQNPVCVDKRAAAQQQIGRIQGICPTSILDHGPLKLIQPAMQSLSALKQGV